MINRVLYWLISLSSGGKALVFAVALLFSVIVCSFIASISTALLPKDQATVQATRTAEAIHEAVLGASHDATAMALLQATSTESTRLDATTTANTQATTIAEANAVSATAVAQAQANQEASATAVAIGPFATQTALIAATGPEPATSITYLYSNETSHSVVAFANSYIAWGGAATLGFPLTELFIETRPDQGKGYWVQYFEKAVIEFHNDVDAANTFQLAPLGTWRLAHLYPGGAPAAKPLPSRSSYHFKETNHTVAEPFLTYWHKNGEVRRFGYPISESFAEKSQANGNSYTVQYFERAVMEYHPELPASDSVQLTALGSLMLKELYPDGAPMGASNALPSPTVNVAATQAAAATATEVAQEAIANATATAQTQAANATSTAEAQAAIAAAAAASKAADATSTAEAQASAAARRKYDSYKYNAPPGNFSASGANAAISCRLQYQQCINDWCANANSKFILVGVGVANIGTNALSVNPLNFTLVSTDGGSVALDNNTFALGNYLNAIDIQPGTHTNGWIAFLVTKDFIPGRLVWQEIFGETIEVTIVEPQ
jgi:hypothetical protein